MLSNVGLIDVDNRIQLGYNYTISSGKGQIMNNKLVITAKRYRGETSVVSARLPVELISELDKAAKESGRNRNEIISICLEYALDNLRVESSETPRNRIGQENV